MTVFFWGFALATALGSLAALGPKVLSSSIQEEEDSVVVVIVGDDARVAQVRSLLDDKRVLVDYPQGIALHEGRVIAADAEAASAVLTSAGWGDSRLDIFTPGSLGRNYDSPRSSGETSTRIRELMNKPELSMIEARELLNWMDTNP